MTIVELIPAHAIAPELRGTDLDGVLAELAELAAAVAGDTGVSPSELAAALHEREAQGSTAVGGGIALPHGVHEGLPRIVAVLGRSLRGVEMGAPDGGRVHLFVAMLRPPDATGGHLQALARVSALLSHAPTRRALADGTSAAEIHATIVARADAVAELTRS